MNVRNVFTFLAIAAASLLLAKAIREQSTGGSTASDGAPSGPVASMVAETLHQHEGEESPFVQAFEHALHPKGQ